MACVFVFVCGGIGMFVCTCKCAVGVCVAGKNSSVFHGHVLSELKTVRYSIPAV